MAHNRSPRKLRSEVMAAPLASYAGFLLEIDCPGGKCPVGRSHRIDALVAHYPGVTVTGVIRRLRCVTCGKGVQSAVLVEPGTGRRFGLLGEEVRY